jgi:hypothetical protein
MGGGMLRTDSPTIRLGLNIPLFIAALIAMGTGTLVGMIGIWTAAAWGRPVPEWEKVGHAHASWWAALIMIAAMVLPSIALKPWAKKLVIAGTFIGPTLWVGTLAFYYEIGGPAFWRVPNPDAPGTYYEVPVVGPVATILEFVGLLALGSVALLASGVKIPLISAKEPLAKSRYELVTDIEVPRRIFLVPTLIIVAGVVAGFAITFIFKAFHRPVSPAALVQLHDHPALISTSALIALLALAALRVPRKIFDLAYKLMLVSLPLVLLGLVLFNFAEVHSIVWVAPAGIYYLIPVIAFIASVGLFRKQSSSDPGHNLGPSPPLRIALAVCFAGSLVLIANGAQLALVWDTHPDITVTFKQPEGSPYPGPYPAKYIGTAPAKGTPRGSENAHFSPGSWFQVAITWLVILALVGGQMFNGGIFNKPGMIYLYAITIPLAPMFNMLGRYLAWLGIPNGIGALWFAGHPIKGFNLISLFIVALLAVYVIRKKS